MQLPLSDFSRAYSDLPSKVIVFLAIQKLVECDLMVLFKYKVKKIQKTIILTASVNRYFVYPLYLPIILDSHLPFMVEFH